MGWNGESIGKNIPTKKYVEYKVGKSFKEVEIVKIFEGVNNFGQKAFYVAVKKIESGEVSAMVVLTQRKNGTIYIKFISEAVVPCYYEAPESFIKVLSPTENVFSQQWREQCVSEKVA